MTDANAYCAALDIPVPRVEDATASAGANFYSLLIATDRWGTPCVLVDAQGWEIPRPEVQLARLATR